MKLWTIHPTIVWELLNKQGCYYGVKDFVYDDEMFLSAYDWMKKQLVIKTGIYKEHYPVWAWYKRPDLRYSGNKNPCPNLIIKLSKTVGKEFLIWIGIKKILQIKKFKQCFGN